MLWKADRLWYALNMECRRYCKEHCGSDDISTAKTSGSYYESVRVEATKRGKEVLEFKAEDGREPLSILGEGRARYTIPAIEREEDFCRHQGYRHCERSSIMSGALWPGVGYLAIRPASLLHGF
ncbi:hypothetical protein QBC33DRAFT_541619 [Phialemonium atrogriseum]|uniref:Uncharacterized protein n=1 Tax=Phialemonium atrogriseum TaxID=1093897 RepID=A0AAJ0BYI8_9PEZI|nr:uncharacterized protein QBC33DRAFT_541619 [Phialemonium atrogriseum]KAK1766636.1 hypothetical protein QBC33DRAFT_541619 [Phialemonium atrogriseum]